MICITNEMFKAPSNSCSISSSHFEGVTSNYELNNGEQYFYIEEIEVYQIIFN